MSNIWIINHHASVKGRHAKLSEEFIKKDNEVTIFASSFKHNAFKETK